MHPALAISELLTHILFQVYNVEAPSRDQAINDISSLSRVCRAFRDPALDVLWRNIDRLHPLLSFLPRLLKALRDPKSSERQRYYSISFRVRTLSFSEPDEPVSRNLIDDIVQSRLFLLPRLETLRLRISSEGGLRLLPALLGGGLTDISLSLDEEMYDFDRPQHLNDLLQSMYITIFQCAPNLVHFSAVDLYETLPSIDLLRIPGQASSQYQSLTHVAFYVTAASLPEVLSLTSQLPNLCDLTIRACEKPFHEFPRFSSFAPEAFSSLKNLTLGGSPEIIGRICCAFPANRNILSVTLRMRGLPTNADVAFMLSGVVAAVSRVSLRKIIMTCVFSYDDLAHWDDIDSGTDADTNSDVTTETDSNADADTDTDTNTDTITHQFTLSIHAIEPALHFPNLEIFSACLGLPLYLTDQDHLRIAQTWRFVQLLYLSSIVQRVIRAQRFPASLGALVYYARYCRRLRALSVCVDASTGESVDACLRAVQLDPNFNLNGVEPNFTRDYGAGAGVGVNGVGVEGAGADLPSPSIQMIDFGPSHVECDFDPKHVVALARAFGVLFSGLEACRACRTEELGVPQAAWTWMKVQMVYEYMAFVGSGGGGLGGSVGGKDLWKDMIFKKWMAEYGDDYEKVALATPGIPMKSDADDARNAEAFNQIMYKAARDELSKISREIWVCE